MTNLGIGGASRVVPLTEEDGRECKGMGGGACSGSSDGVGSESISVDAAFARAAWS